MPTQNTTQSPINNGQHVHIPVSPREGDEILYRYNRMKEDHFPTKLYRMLEDVERFGNKSVISWSNDGLFFIVHQPKVFAESWMKKYFNQSKYKSFQRQLNFYKFQRVAHGKVLGVYSHPLFRRGQMETLNEIRRIKQQPSAASLAVKAKKEVRKHDSTSKAPPTTTTTATATIRNGSFMSHSSLQTTIKPDVSISMNTLRNQAQRRTVSCDYFSNIIITPTPPKLLMLDPAMFVHDNTMANREISLTMKPYNNNINVNRNSLLGSSTCCPTNIDSNLLYEEFDNDETSIGTIEDVCADICKSSFEQTFSPDHVSSIIQSNTYISPQL